MVQGGPLLVVIWGAHNSIYRGEITPFTHVFSASYRGYPYLELPVVRNYRSKLKQHFFLLFGVFFALFQK